METKSPNVAIIYNRFNLEAVLAAAMIKTAVPGAQAYDATQDAPLKSVIYFWVGVDPSKVDGFYEKLHSREHKVFVDEGPIRPTGLQLNPFKTKFPDLPEETQDDFVKKGPSIIDKVIEHFDLSNHESYAALAFHAGHFYDRENQYKDVDEQVKFLGFVHTNVLHAEECIANCKPFELLVPISQQVEAYTDAIRKVSSVLSNSYRKITVVDGTKTRNAIQTCVSDPVIYRLVKRLCLLSHSYYVNMTMGLSGPILYSNMRHIKIDQIYGSPLLLN